jgi:hypothetical protein
LEHWEYPKIGGISQVRSRTCGGSYLQFPHTTARGITLLFHPEDFNIFNSDGEDDADILEYDVLKSFEA